MHAKTTDFFRTCTVWNVNGSNGIRSHSVGYFAQFDVRKKTLSNFKKDLFLLFSDDNKWFSVQHEINYGDFNEISLHWIGNFKSKYLDFRLLGILIRKNRLRM